MRRLIVLAAAGFLVSGAGVAQWSAPEVLESTEGKHLGVAAGPQERLAFFLPLDKGYVVANAPKVSQGASLFQLFAVRRDGSHQQLPIKGAFLPRAASAGGKWVLAAIGDSVGGRPYLIDAETGAGRPVPSEGRLYASAIGWERLALLRIQGDETRVAVYDCDTLAVKKQFPVEAAPHFASLAFTGPDRLLVIERDTAKFSIVTLSPQLKAGPLVQLSGPEAERSLRHARERAVGVPGNSRFRRAPPILVHLTAVDGNNLFILQPHDDGDARLVKYDPAGGEMAAYRMHVSGGKEARRQMSVRQGLIRTAGGKILWLGQDGVIREFERP